MNSSTWKRRCGAAVMGALVSVSLVACASMPTSGDPQAVPPIDMPTTDTIEQTGFGPQDDSSPEQLVRDFLRACAAGASSNDYSTARQYLLPLVANDWKPDARVLVYPNDETPHTASADATSTKTTVAMEVRIRASVDGEGIFADAGDDTTQVQFEMSRDPDGQWRISALEDGVILAQTSFVAAFQQVQLYFLSADRQVLVPDPRWFPQKRLASHLMSGLVAGPREQLKAAVFSELQTLKLPTQGVELDDQTVQVDLVGELPSGETARKLLSWQVTATLQQVRNLTKVVIRVNSVEIEPVELPLGQAPILDTAVGMSKGTIVDTDGGSWREMLSSELVGENASSPARGPVEEYAMAWLNGSEQLAIRPHGTQISRYPLANPTAPSVDRWGWVWTSTTGADETVLAIDGRGGRIAMDLPDGMIKDVQKVAVSPDGTQLAMKVRDEEGAKLWIGVIVRNGLGAPIEIQQPQFFSQAGDHIVDFSWSGAVTVAALRNAGENESEMVLVPLGAFASSSKVPQGVTRIAAGSQTTRVYLQGLDGQIYFRRGAFWPKLDDEVEYISFPG